MKHEKWFILSLRTILFFEAFVMVQLAFFWITFVGDRIQNENLFDVFGHLIPLLMLGIVNSWWKSKIQQENIRKVQPFLNLIIILFSFGLIVFYQSTNWLYFPLPFSWNYGIWWFLLGLVLCALLGFEHTLPYSYEIMKSKKDLFEFGFVFIIGWILTTIFIKYSRYFSLLLIVLLFTHTLLCIYYFVYSNVSQNSRLLQEHKGIEDALIYIPKEPSVTNEDTLSSELQKSGICSEKYYHRFSKNVATLLAFQLLSGVFYKIFDMNSYLSLEVTWNQIIHFFQHWMLFLGIIVGICAIILQVQYKKPGILIGLGINLLLTMLGFVGVFYFAPFIFGLNIVLLFWTVTNSKPLLYGIVSWFLIIIWLAGLLGGNFLGVFYTFRWIFVLGFNAVVILFFGIIVMLDIKYQKRIKEEMKNV